MQAYDYLELIVEDLDGVVGILESSEESVSGLQAPHCRHLAILQREQLVGAASQICCLGERAIEAGLEQRQNIRHVSVVT